MTQQKKEELQIEIMEDYLRDARFGERLITEEDQKEHLEVMRKHWDKLCNFCDTILNEKIEKVKSVPWCDLENGRGRYLLESEVIAILEE